MWWWPLSSSDNKQQTKEVGRRVSSQVRLRVLQMGLSPWKTHHTDTPARQWCYYIWPTKAALKGLPVLQVKMATTTPKAYKMASGSMKSTLKAPTTNQLACLIEKPLQTKRWANKTTVTQPLSLHREQSKSCWRGNHPSRNEAFHTARSQEGLKLLPSSSVIATNCLNGGRQSWIPSYFGGKQGNDQISPTLKTLWIFMMNFHRVPQVKF